MFCDISVLVELSPFVTMDLLVYSGDSILIEPELGIYTFTTPQKPNHTPEYVKVLPFDGVC